MATFSTIRFVSTTLSLCLTAAGFLRPANVPSIGAQEPQKEQSFRVRNGEKVFRVASDVMASRVVSKSNPVNPMKNWETFCTYVYVPVTIGKQGIVEEMGEGSGAADLIPYAKDAVWRWKYRPYLIQGEPVVVETFVTVPFGC